MKIVILDGKTLNPGDLDWAPIERFGELEIYDRTPAEAVLQRAAGAEILLTNKTPLTRQTIETLGDLRYIGVLATGYNVVDVDAARQRGISVSNVPGYGTAAVAQMVFALLLELTQQVGHHASLVRQGRWSASPDFCFWDRPLVELDSLTMGVVGFGEIGRKVAGLARAFGMRVLVHTRNPQKYKAAHQGNGLDFCDLDGLFLRSDVVSLNCPLSAETAGMVNSRRLGLMKSSAFLINTGRGPLVDERALAEALRGGQLAGAGLDVLAQEPPAADNPLLQAPNCVITPHIAWAARAARQRLLTTAVANVEGFVCGRPQNLVT